MLDKLPIEIIEEISIYLRITDVISLFSTNKKMNNIINEDFINNIIKIKKFKYDIIVSEQLFDYISHLSILSSNEKLIDNIINSRLKNYPLCLWLASLDKYNVYSQTEQELKLKEEYDKDLYELKLNPDKVEKNLLSLPNNKNKISISDCLKNISRLDNIKQIVLTSDVTTEIPKINNLEDISLIECLHIDKLLNSLNNINIVSIHNCTHLSTLSGLRNIHTLKIEYCERLMNLSGLNDIHILLINSCNRLKDLSRIKDINIHTLGLKDMKIITINNLYELSNIHTLKLCEMKHITDEDKSKLNNLDIIIDESYIG